ncbi:MAG: 4Fe-4S dicluster domain-containing protein, partial [Deltaproteobacteria bacterium]|nr:4Fe-4S dicluster domain-containing protein [Deltaproteobacteria bacterium]
KKTVSQVPQATLQTVPRAYPDTVRVLLGLPHDPNHNDFSAGAAAQDACMVEPFVLAALHSAHSDGIPFIRQLITVTGSAVHTPQNMWVPCGSPLDYLIAQAGGNPGMHGRVSAGGPLMGLPQHRLDTPLLKTIHGLYCAAGLSFDEERKSRFYQRCACVRCAKCFDVCPAGVHPISITELIEHQRQDEAAVMGLNSCLECGLCAYVCPSQIPLTDLIITGKERLTDPAGSLLTGRYKTLI